MNRSMATTHSDVRARVGNISLWLLQIALGGLFAFNFGLGKVMGSEQSVELFADIGVGQWLRFLTGILEIAAWYRPAHPTPVRRRSTRTGRCHGWRRHHRGVHR